MIVYTDNKYLGSKYFSEKKWYKCNIGYQNKEIRTLLNELFSIQDIYTTEVKDNYQLWQFAFIVDQARQSQYDILVNLAQEINLANGILCFADYGKGFHGFHNRSWTAESGNIHLSAFLKPNQSIKNFASSFLVLSANSVVQTIDNIPELKGKASIKWVNDILLGNAKISGVLAHTHAQGELIKDVVLGIGANIQSKPQVDATQFVPEATCLNEFLEINDDNFALFIKHLLTNIAKNYHSILENKYMELVEFYIRRSIIIGKEVSVWSDSPKSNNKIINGVVEKIGENLELYFKNISKPITNGRLSID